MISTTFLAGFMGMGPTELIVILVILLVLFGGSKLPGLAKGLGQSIKEFKKASKDEVEAEPEPAKPIEPKKSEATVRHGTN
jgi:sec-independent protein translocase protein TatA